MTKKKIISLMAVVMVIQLLVPFGIVAKKNNDYKKVEQYGTVYMMKVSEFWFERNILPNDYYLNFDFYIEDMYEDTDILYIKTEGEKSYFTRKNQVKQINNYVDSYSDKDYYFGSTRIHSKKLVYVPAEVIGEQSFLEFAKQEDIKHGDTAVQIKVYRGKAIITDIFYKGEKVIKLENCRMT